MKKIFIPLILVVLCLSVTPAHAQTKFRAFTALTGGGTGAIDKIPIAELTNGDIAFTVTADYFYVHRFDSAATTAENSPTYIRPDDYATAGVWELQGLYGAAVANVPSTEPTIAFKDIDATDGDENATISVNCTDTGSGSEDCDLVIKTQSAGTLTTRMTIDGDGGISFAGSVTATGSFIIGSADLNETDMEKLDGITNGTQAANKAVVADANVNTGVSKVTELHIGASGSEVQVTATAAELNYNDIASLGTGAASKAVVLDGSGNYTAPAGTWNMSGATAITLGALNLATTGTVTGAIKINSDANGMSSGEMTTAGMYGSLYVATGAGTWNLPAAAAGMSFCMLVPSVAAVVINPDDSDVLVYDGTADTAGHQISGGAAAGDFICFIAVDTTNWHSMGRRGTWTPGS